MWDAAIVCVRESAELLFIIEAMRLALRVGPRSRLATLVVPSAFAGILVAVGLSVWAEAHAHGDVLTVLLGVFFLVGIVGLACGMLSSVQAIRSSVRSRLGAAIDGPAAPVLVVLLAAVSAMRETLEVTAMLDAVADSDGTRAAFQGAVAGLLAASAMVLLYRRMSDRVDFLAAFRLSSLLVSIVSLHLLIPRVGRLVQLTAGTDSRLSHWSHAVMPGGALIGWAWATLALLPAAALLRAWWAESRR